MAYRTILRAFGSISLTNASRASLGVTAMLMVALLVQGCTAPEAFHPSSAPTTAPGTGGGGGDVSTLPVTMANNGVAGAGEAGMPGSPLPTPAGSTGPGPVPTGTPGSGADATPNDGSASASVGTTGAAGALAGTGGGTAGTTSVAGTLAGMSNGMAGTGASADAAAPSDQASAPSTDASATTDLGAPPPPPTPYGSIGWKASASITAAGAANLPPNVFDGNLATRWTTGRPQAGNESFVLDLGKAVSVSEIVLDDTKDPNDYPSAYALDVSTDGAKFTSVKSGPGATVTDIIFTAATLRYIRIRQTGTTPVNWWSIDELRVYP